MQKDKYKMKLLGEITKHVGKANAIGMVELYRVVFGYEPKSKISGTRRIRQLITELRKEGVPICSSTQRDGGGYYLASVSSDLETYLGKIRKRAIKALSLEAKLRNIALPELIGRVQLNMEDKHEGSM